ncbi:MAG: phenylalanine--tRNA ligase subunit beta [Eubacteriales bacterium]|nr:phenylalanine--tRNA ligase subunit beta [Eubacteriales bacterium]
MNLSRKWLNEFVDLPLSEVDDRAFAEAMSVSGSKVETTEDLSKTMKNVKVGKVVSIERHPDSDHMWVCQIDVGSGEPVQICTGAQNVKQGDLVPAALDNSLLPGGIEIKAKPLRGVPSYGMLCSFKELGATSHDFPYAIEDGILILQGDYKPGDDMAEKMGLDDHVVEFEITPNRPDCLCVIGLARETACTFNKSLKLHEPVVKAAAGGDVKDMAKVVIEDPNLCPRYTARMVKNVKIAPSPEWMAERIRNSGMRPINNIVDITNYVMLEYGQPMHAFDFSCVENGEIHVRRAKPGETIRTLDGSERTLSPEMLCICDTEKPVAVAGVMGGENSEIVGDTAMVLFESACFSGPSVRRTATSLGMRTDASARFEKGLDAWNTEKAVDRACELIELLGAGEVVGGVIDVIPEPLKKTTVKLEPEKINALLGTDVSEAQMRKILSDLGFTFDGDIINVPSWRGDVEHYSDIAEEVARFYGYNEIPTKFTGAISSCGGFTPEQQCERTCGEILRSLGLDEIITYSFISPTYYDKIRLPEDSPLRDSLKILNPLGEDTSIMRTTVLPSMLEILTRNFNFRNKTACLYEIGRVYNKRPDGLADEPRIISVGMYGEGVDFFVLKNVVATLADKITGKELRFVAEKENPSYHPGRCAKVYVGEEYIGVFGQIHPAVADNYGVDCELYCAELSFGKLFELRRELAVYKPLPKFPSVSRDLAVVCDKSVPVGELIACIKRFGGEFLKDCTVFDVYTGHHIAEGSKSVAFSLTMRADDRTMTDDDAESTVKKVLSALSEKFNAVIR